MNVLIIDSFFKYNCLSQHNIIIEPDKTKALSLLHSFKPDCVIINVQFNTDFVETIRLMKPSVAIYLVNETNSGYGLDRYANIIDGYFITSGFETLLPKRLTRLANRLPTPILA